MRGPYFAVVGRAVLQIVIIPFSLDFGPLRRRLCGVYGKLMFCLQIAFVVLGVYLSDLLEKLSERFDPSPIIAQELRGLTQFLQPENTNTSRPSLSAISVGISASFSPMLTPSIRASVISSISVRIG